MDSHDRSFRFRSGQQRGGKSSVASKTDRELRVALTEHLPDLSCAHCTGSGVRSPDGPPASGRTSPLRGEVRPSATSIDQFKEALASPAAAADVDPFGCCTLSDPSAPPEAV